MLKELKVLNDIYKQDEEGEVVLVKKNVITKCFIDISDFTGPVEVINMQGKPYKTRCRIMHKDLGELVVNHRYAEIKKLKESKKIIGFKR